MILQFLLLLVLVLSGSGAAGAVGSVFNVAVVEDGLYRLQFGDLHPLPDATLSSSISLLENGRAVPIDISDGGDGTFNHGDSILFSGRHLEGSNAWHNEYSRYNVYQLHLDDFQAPLATTLPSGGPFVEHLEQDRLRTALAHAAYPEQEDIWYWQRITHVADDGFAQRLDWRARPHTLRVALSGLSRDMHASTEGLPQHHVVIRLDGKTLGEVTWDGQSEMIFESADMGKEPALDSSSLLEIDVTPRTFGTAGEVIIDAVLLNWIEVDYGVNPGRPLAAIPDRDGLRRLLVPEEHLRPAWIEPVRPQRDLTAEDQQVDYLMISHERLTDALEPLAAYHRAQGLVVEIIDVQSIYDQFNGGIESPLALRRFIRHAWEGRRAPAPRFVLLAGDASWERDSRKADSRNLVPTMQSYGKGGLAASDNGLVAFSDDNWRPDLAIGRLPASTAAELSVMVEKLIRYATAAPEGEWRQRTIWIADADPTFQRISETLSDGLAARALSSKLIFPDHGAEHSPDGQQRIFAAFNEGGVLLHFLGHGGRYVWRTGPRDLMNSTDLFSMQDVESLARSNALPVVLSMTCSSGPFDHPSADSIAEVLLRNADRGAIGVVSASRRVPPSRRFSRLLVEALTENGAHIGEALMHAKQRERRRTLVESYNLLGDPALRLPVRTMP